jgi:hypothetical protein
MIIYKRSTGLYFPALSFGTTNFESRSSHEYIDTMLATVTTKVE